MPTELYRTGRGTVAVALDAIKCSRLENKYHYRWQQIRHNLFRHDHMFKSSPAKYAPFTSWNTERTSQGKAFSVKSRLSCNHHRAVALSRFGISDLQRTKPVHCCASAWCTWKEIWKAVYIRGAEQTVPSVKQCGKKWYPCNRDKTKQTTMCKIENKPNLINCKGTFRLLSPP